LVSNRAALDFCLLGNPCVRGVVGVDDDLLHAGDCMLGSLGTTSTTFHKVSQRFIRMDTKKPPEGGSQRHSDIRHLVQSFSAPARFPASACQG
jgi:hypothetical protein